MSWTYTFNPGSGALRAAISSGQVHLIKNKRLVEILFAYEDIVGDSYEEAERIRKFHYDSMALKASNIRLTDEWQYSFPDLLPPIYESRPRQLLKDKDFENFSILAYSYTKEYLVELKDIENLNREVLSLISSELAL